jgi:hypothetical protein
LETRNNIAGFTVRALFYNGTGGKPMAETCMVKGCALAVAGPSEYCEGHRAEIERAAGPSDVHEAVELVRRTPWTVLWCVKNILDGEHPHTGDDVWLAETQRLNDEGRLELRQKRFHYKLDDTKRFTPSAVR